MPNVPPLERGKGTTAPICLTHHSNRLAQMVASGAVFSNACDMVSFRPDLFRSQSAAAHARARSAGRVEDVRAAVAALVQHAVGPWIEVHFQPSGRGRRRRAAFCPAGHARALRKVVESAYGP